MQNNDKHWHAIVTKPKHEFKVFEKIQALNIESFLPTIERLRQWKDRKKLVTFPLFSNYIFVRLYPKYDEVLNVLKIKGVIRFLGISQSNPEIIPCIQIDSVRKLLENKQELDIYPYLIEGKTVTINKGALSGVEGLLVKKDSQQHILVVSIDLLGQSVCLKIDVSHVKR